MSCASQLGTKHSFHAMSGIVVSHREDIIKLTYKCLWYGVNVNRLCKDIIDVFSPIRPVFEQFSSKKQEPLVAQQPSLKDFGNFFPSSDLHKFATINSGVDKIINVRKKNMLVLFTVKKRTFIDYPLTSGRSAKWHTLS